jgi:alpha-tubulin suppressor-like RCC1 family protein
VDIDCNAFFACAVVGDGSVRCWGDNRNGQLGDITTDARHTHEEVYGVENAIQVVTSRSHACALQRGGTVMCWGDNEHGQVGTGTSSNNVLRATQALLYTGNPLKGVVELTTGGGQPYSDSSLDPSGFTCARKRNGEVVCWGRNQVGRLGYGVWDDNGRVAPPLLDSARYPVQQLPDALQISGGHQHACAIAPDGTLRCWGGGEGQLPDDNIWIALSPLLIEGL